MAAYTHQQLLEKIARRDVSPVILLYGEETLLIDECVDALISALIDPALREFNLDIMDGARSDMRDVLAKASSFPMMSERRMVVVRTVERLSGSDQVRDLFSAYVHRPLESTQLVLVAEKVDFRKKPYNELKKHADFVEYKGLYDNEVPSWAVQRCKSLGKAIEIDAARLLQGYVGNSLMSIQRELEKLITFVGDRAGITVEDVAAVAGASRGYTIFDLQNAIGRRDYRSSSVILRKMLESGESAQYIIVMLTRFFTQLWKLRELKTTKASDNEIASQLRVGPYFVKSYVKFLEQYTVPEVESSFQALRGADSRLKSTGGNTVSEMDLLIHAIVRSRSLAATRPRDSDVMA